MGAAACQPRAGAHGSRARARRRSRCCARRRPSMHPTRGSGTTSGLALISLNRLDEALKAFNYSLAIAPLARALQRARIHHFRDDGKRAFEHANAAIRLDPRFFDAHLLLGDLYRKRRDAENTRKSYLAATRLAPNNARVRNAYAEYLAASGGSRKRARNIGASSRACSRAISRPPWARCFSFPPCTRATRTSSAGAPITPRDSIRCAVPPAASASPRRGRPCCRRGGPTSSSPTRGATTCELQRAFGTLMSEVLTRNVPGWMQPRKLPAPREKHARGFLQPLLLQLHRGPLLRVVDHAPGPQPLRDLRLLHQRAHRRRHARHHGRERQVPPHRGPLVRRRGPRDRRRRAGRPRVPGAGHARRDLLARFTSPGARAGGGLGTPDDDGPRERRLFPLVRCDGARGRRAPLQRGAGAASRARHPLRDARGERRGRAQGLRIARRRDRSTSCRSRCSRSCPTTTSCSPA